MGTKKIREALVYVYQTGTTEQVIRAQAAMAEVTAIEKAARVVAAQGIYECVTDTPEERRAIEEAEELFITIKLEAGK